MPTAFYNAADFMTGGATEEDALIAADAAATSDGGGVVLLPSDFAVTATSSFTVQNPLVLAGGVIQPTNGVSVTVEKVIDPGAVQWIDLSNGGKVILRQFARLDWWGSGASGSHSTADQTANYAALRAAYAAFDGQGGVVEFQGTVVVGVRDANGFVVLITEPNVTLRPRDDNAEFMLANGVVDGSGLDLSVFRTNANVAGLRWENFRWNGNGTNNLLPSGTGTTEPNLLLEVFDLPAGDDIYIDCTARNHSGARIVGIGSAISIPKRPYVRVRAHNMADAVTGNIHSFDHTTVWMRCDGGEVPVVELTNDTMAASATALEFHGTRQSAGLVSVKNARFAYLPVALFGDSLGCQVGTIALDSVQCAVSIYVGSSYRLQHSIGTIVGTQANELYPLVDDETVSAGADGSLLAIGRVAVENLVASPTGDEAFVLRAGKLKGRIRVDSIVARRMPCGILGSVNPVSTNATEISIGHYTAEDCCRSSSSALGLNRPIRILSGNKIKSLTLGHGVLRNTPGSASPMVGWLYLDAPIGDLSIGEVDPGTVPPAQTTGSNYAFDRAVPFRLPVSGSIANGATYDIELTSKAGTLRLMVAGATKRVGAVFGFGTVAVSPIVISASDPTSVATADSLNDLCVFWNSGKLRIKNNLGEAVDFSAIAEWT